MKSRASGSLTAIRALFFGPSGLREAPRRFLDSSSPVWLCGVSLLLAGLAGVSLGLAQGWMVFGDTMYSYTGDERPYEVVMTLMCLSTLLLTAGLLCLHVLPTGRPRWVRRLSASGTLLAALAGIGSVAGVLYVSLSDPLYYSSTWGVLDLLYSAGYLGLPAGIVLVGVAALWSRGLGIFRGLPLAAGLVVSPLSGTVLWWLLPPGDMLVPGTDAGEVALEALRFAAPATLAGVLWVSLGFAAFGVRKKEDALLARERRETEEGNLTLARRLYREAWGAGNVAVLDELAAPEFFDRRRERRGPEGLRRAILDLYRTFPDLQFSVEEQRADGDAVTTRGRFAGTDRGGLLWYPPTGRHADFSATYANRFSGGRLVEHDGGTDTPDLLRQLGLTHPVEGERSRQRRP